MEKFSMHLVFSLALVALLTFFSTTFNTYAASQERKGENCKFKNPDTNLIDKRFISSAQCHTWEQFWCLVDEQVSDVGIRCKIIIGLMPEEQKDKIMKRFGDKIILYMLKDPRFFDKLSKCEGYDSAKKTCAVAGDFTNCMKITWNKDYSTLKSVCE
jgi:hypothetical protein